MSGAERRLLGRHLNSSRRRCLGFEALESRRLLAVFTVNSGADSGPGSLREAIDMANALPGPDTIDFLGVSEIRLTTSQLTVTDALTISGADVEDGVTITAVDADPDPEIIGDGIRVFRVDSSLGDNAPLTLDQLTIVHQLGLEPACLRADHLPH